MFFHDRFDAGRRLAAQFTSFAQYPGLLVLGLPRGGIPVGFEIARSLKAPLDVLVVRKLGAPNQPELAIGAVASGGIEILDSALIRELRIDPAQVQEIASRERVELERRAAAYRAQRSPIDVAGRTVILVDDGIATGSSMRAAVAVMRRQSAKQVIVAVPVAARSACESMSRLADSVVCLNTPLDFYAVGEWYTDFSQTTDDEVRDLLARSLEFAPGIPTS